MELTFSQRCGLNRYIEAREQLAALMESSGKETDALWPRRAEWKRFFAVRVIGYYGT